MLSAALDGAVYAIGGYNSIGLSSVELFDVRADRWRCVAAMTNPRCYGAAVAHQGKVWGVPGDVASKDFTEITLRPYSCQNLHACCQIP